MFDLKLEEYGLALITPILQMREPEPEKRSSVQQLTSPSHPVSSLAYGACSSFAILPLFGRHYSCALQEKRTPNRDHKVWGQVQTPPLTGCAIWGCYLTTLAFLVHLQNAAWQLLCWLHGVVPSHVGWEGGAEDLASARRLCDALSMLAAGWAEGISASPVPVPSACGTLVAGSSLPSWRSVCSPTQKESTFCLGSFLKAQVWYLLRRGEKTWHLLWDPPLSRGRG